MNDRDCAVIEARLLQHEKQLMDITKSIYELRKDMALIHGSLSQIRNLSYGAAAFYVVSNVGLLEALNLVS